MTKDDAVLVRFQTLGITTTVYSNRIEVEQRTIGTQRTVIPLRSISSVKKPPFMRVVEVQTNDGKKHKLVAGKDTDALYDAIMRLL